MKEKYAVVEKRKQSSTTKEDKILSTFDDRADAVDFIEDLRDEYDIENEYSDNSLGLDMGDSIIIIADSSDYEEYDTDYAEGWTIFNPENSHIDQRKLAYIIR